MDSIEGFILAGGQSRRMGTDKSRLTLDGQTFIEIIAKAISPIAPAVSVVGTTGDPDPALRHVPDIYQNWGALGGVHAALSACEADWTLVVACDFPFVTTELFRHMASVSAESDAVAPIQRDLIPQPLCALYRTTPCLQTAERLIKTGERKPLALLQSVTTRWVAFDEISNLEGATHFFDNINTPEDYVRVAKNAPTTTRQKAS